MTALIIVVLLCLALFLMSFITRRRFGILGLAVSAGALLSLHWTDMLTPFLESHGIVFVTPPLTIMVQFGLVLIPPFLLLFKGPTYTKMLPRLAGSFAFVVLAMTFLADILAPVLLLEGSGAVLFQFLHDYKSIFIVAGIIGAVADMLLTGKSHRDNKKSAH